MTTRRWIILGFGLLGTGILCAQSPADIITYINTYKGLAIEEMQRTGVPSSIILAQGIHETEAGTSTLVKQSNNHFGIKCKDSWNGAVVYHDDDTRGECFRSYPTAEDSYKDHSDFLRSSPRYQFLFKLDPANYEGWAHGLRKAGYATNIRYSQILIKLVEDYGLQQYSLIAMGKMKPEEEVPPGGLYAKTTLPSEKPADSLRPALSFAPARQYPDGEFSINNTRVIFARSGTALLAIADQYQVSLARLIDFNDLKGEEVLVRDQLLYLQRKRKTGAVEFHIVQPGENLYDICQQEGIRYESLLELNKLSGEDQPAPGEKLYLLHPAASRPALVGEKNETVQKEPRETAAQPTPITHRVQYRETLYSISKKYGVEVEKIQEWNKLDSMQLKKGQELIIYKN